jgi:hypothetical protein
MAVPPDARRRKLVFCAGELRDLSAQLQDHVIPLLLDSAWFSTLETSG